MDLPYFFRQAIEKGASDLHLVEGSVPSLRVSGEMVRLGDVPIPSGELRYAVFNTVSKEIKERFLRMHDIDISFEQLGTRFRVNLHSQEGRMGLSARQIPTMIPTAQDIRLEEVVYNLTHLKDGLVLMTGASGVGKSTTLAVMLNTINAERRSHIITVEDPIEYIFQDKQSMVEQREVGRDTESFASALKYALRQDPNVIMVGEMRDLETIQAALTAATTGHLVLSTLHTATAAETLERILDFFDPSDAQQISHQLASVLRAVVSQQLLPCTHGGLIAAREILINNRAVANLIRTGQVAQIENVMQTSTAEGMVLMNQALDELYREGLISEQVVRNRRRDDGTKAVYY